MRKNTFRPRRWPAQSIQYYNHRVIKRRNDIKSIKIRQICRKIDEILTKIVKCGLQFWPLLSTFLSAVCGFSYPTAPSPLYSYEGGRRMFSQGAAVFEWITQTARGLLPPLAWRRVKLCEFISHRSQLSGLRASSGRFSGFLRICPFIGDLSAKSPQFLSQKT